MSLGSVPARLAKLERLVESNSASICNLCGGETPRGSIVISLGVGGDVMNDTPPCSDCGYPVAWIDGAPIGASMSGYPATKPTEIVLELEDPAELVKACARRAGECGDPDAKSELEELADLAKLGEDGRLSGVCRAAMEPWLGSCPPSGRVA